MARNRRARCGVSWGVYGAIPMIAAVPHPALKPYVCPTCRAVVFSNRPPDRPPRCGVEGPISGFRARIGSRELHPPGEHRAVNMRAR